MLSVQETANWKRPNGFKSADAVELGILSSDQLLLNQASLRCVTAMPLRPPSGSVANAPAGLFRHQKHHVIGTVRSRHCDVEEIKTRRREAHHGSPTNILDCSFPRKSLGLQSWPTAYMVVFGGESAHVWCHHRECLVFDIGSGYFPAISPLQSPGYFNCTLVLSYFL